MENLDWLGPVTIVIAKAALQKAQADPEYAARVADAGRAVEMVLNCEPTTTGKIAVLSAAILSLGDQISDDRPDIVLQAQAMAVPMLIESMMPVVREAFGMTPSYGGDTCGGASRKDHSRRSEE